MTIKYTTFGKVPVEIKRQRIVLYWKSTHAHKEHTGKDIHCRAVCKSEDGSYNLDGKWSPWTHVWTLSPQLKVLFYVGASLGEVCLGVYSSPSCFLIHQEVSKQPHGIAITSVRHSIPIAVPPPWWTVPSNHKPKLMVPPLWCFLKVIWLQIWEK